MSSAQAETPARRPGIPLSHLSDNKSFRLLELPPDLLALLESESPPPIHLEPGAPHAVLVTPEKRYILTQRNTSNSLILLSPSEPKATAQSSTALGLNIVGTVHETIELTPEPAKC